MKYFRNLFLMALVVFVFSQLIVPASSLGAAKISKSKAKKIAKSHIATHEDLLIPEGKPSRVNVERGEILFDPSTRKYTELSMRDPSESENKYEKRKTWFVSITYEPSDEQTDIYRMHVDAISGVVTKYTVEIK